MSHPLDVDYVSRARWEEATEENERLKQEYGVLSRTMKFWEESYLAEHEHWGHCKFKVEVAALREENERLTAQLAAVRGAVSELRKHIEGRK